MRHGVHLAGADVDVGHAAALVFDAAGLEYARWVSGFLEFVKGSSLFKVLHFFK